MGVLIRGMKMPKTCNICPCFERDWQDDDIVGYCKAKKTKLQKYKIPFACPLVEVPPHGRLIDKDKLRRELFLNFNGERIPFYDCDNFPTTLTYRDLHSILAEQPTIIEAEE